MPRAAPAIPSTIHKRLERAKVARLATVDANRIPQLIPICFAFDGKVFYTAVDRKPKRVAANRLARLRNIKSNPKVALLIDEYHEDWTRLWYVLVRGRALLLPGSATHERAAAIRMLRAKYPQYAAGMLADDAPIIRITPERITAWASRRPNSALP